jgi:DNA-binding transcriptional MerR regulator
LKNRCETCLGDGRISTPETVEVRIPAGAQQGSRLRVAGKGNAGTHGASAGDLYITVRVEPHAFFRRDGDDIEISVPVRIDEAGLGTKIEVPTIDGRALLKIPQGTKNGQKFRLREKGVLNARTGQRGDQIVEAVIEAPVVQDERTKELLREYAKLHPEDPRASLWEKGVMAAKRSKAAYMISSVAEQYGLHPQTLRLYEREGLLKPSRSDGNTRLYTDDDLERLEVILKLTRDLGVNLAGVEIILNMREKMGEMQRQIEEFVSSLNTEFSHRGRPAAVESNNSLIPVIVIKRPKRADNHHRVGSFSVNIHFPGDPNPQQMGQPASKIGALRFVDLFFTEIDRVRVSQPPSR